MTELTMLIERGIFVTSKIYTYIYICIYIIYVICFHAFKKILQ